MSMFEQRVLRAAKEIITSKTDRDMQVSIGPSDMADPCNKCLASKLAGVKPHREFSMFPWLGTAMHKMIEWTADAVRFRHRPGENDMAWELFGDGRALFELRILVCDIEGYGEVHGNIDVVLLNEGGIVDWKSTSKKKIATYRVKGPPDAYLGQLMLYLFGLRKAGYNMDSGVLVFIPRDAFTPGDIWAYEVKYSQEMVDAILGRIDQLMAWVKADRWKELPSDPDCWVCHPKFFG